MGTVSAEKDLTSLAAYLRHPLYGQPTIPSAGLGIPDFWKTLGLGIIAALIGFYGPFASNWNTPPMNVAIGFGIVTAVGYQMYLRRRAHI